MGANASLCRRYCLAYFIRLKASMVWRVFALKLCAQSKVFPMVTSIMSRVLGVKLKLKFVGMMPSVQVVRYVRFRFFNFSFISVMEAGFVTSSWDSTLVSNFGEFLSKFCVLFCDFLLRAWICWVSYQPRYQSLQILEIKTWGFGTPSRKDVLVRKASLLNS